MALLTLKRLGIFGLAKVEGTLLVVEALEMTERTGKMRTMVVQSLILIRETNESKKKLTNETNKQ